MPPSAKKAQPGPSVLRIPQSQAAAEITDQLQIGRALATEAESFEEEHTDLRGQRVSEGVEDWKAFWEKITKFMLRIRSWDQYNSNWLARNLGGEAAREYRDTRRDKVGKEERAYPIVLIRDLNRLMAQLESIHDRLSLWASQPGTTTRPDTLRAQNAHDAPIFVVHGHDTLRAEAIARTVERATGRETIILREQANLGRTLIEKFEQHATEAAYAIIVLTPDDHGSSATDTSLHPRARQNVIFEMGYFYGIIGRRNVSVLLHPSVEKPSDTDGIVYISLDDNGTWKTELFRELRSADIKIKL